MILRLLNLLGRAAYRLRTGESCHCYSNWGPWQMQDLGRRKVRRCKGCGWTQVVG